jgi:RNA polymerase sigma-70 factor (ECF subfamily)
MSSKSPLRLVPLPFRPHHFVGRYVKDPAHVATSQTKVPDLVIEERAIIAEMPATDDSDASVIRQLRAGRNVEHNFRILFQKYYPGVTGFFTRHGLSAEESRDLTQDVFLAVYSGLKTLRNDDAFVGWLFSISRHVWFRYLERQKRFPQATAARAGGDAADDEARIEESLADGEPDALHRMLEMEKIALMREALKDLPVRVQECLRARVVDGMKYSEIGERLGISENTVAVHVHRGLKNLKARAKKVFTGAPFIGEV